MWPTGVWPGLTSLFDQFAQLFGQWQVVMSETVLSALLTADVVTTYKVVTAMVITDAVVADVVAR